MGSIETYRFKRVGRHVPTRIDGAPVYQTNGGIYYADQAASAGGDGLTWANAFPTIQEAVSAASAGDVIYVAPGQYDETVTIAKSLTLIGTGGRGAAFIENDTVGGEGMLVTANDVTVQNLGIAGESTADYSLRVAADRFRAYGCKIEGADAALVMLAAAGDVIFEDCEFAWGVNGVLAEAGGLDASTQIVLKDCRFHNITTVHVSDGTNSFANIQIIDCVFDAAEDGTEPTDYLLLDAATCSGVVTGCRFAILTNDTAKLTIGANIQWLANATEAGWSTGRPA